ncbi:MAG: acyl carrier protein [Candidatus Omnitrophica bacterium]|nr:acyl carrier protein [Candidatus Omnitrophota bacterium]
MRNIEEEILTIIAEIIEKDPAEITLDAKFYEDLGVDSMMALEILTALEKKYRITIPEEKLPQITTLRETVAIAQEFLGRKEPADA